MERCTMPKANLRMCSRAARYRYVLERDGRDPADHGMTDVTVAAVCSQHFTGTGTARLLRPFAWDYSYVLDLKTGERIA